MPDLKPWEKAAQQAQTSEQKPWEIAASKKKVSKPDSVSGGLTSLSGSDPFRIPPATDVPQVYTPEKQAEVRQTQQDLSNRLQQATGAYQAAQGDEALAQVQEAQTLEKPPAPPSFGESVSGTFDNLITSLKGTVPRLNMIANAALENTIGKELTGKLSALPRIEFSENGVDIVSGRTAEEIRDQAITSLDDLAAQRKETAGLVDNIADFNIPGVAAGVVDAVGSLAATAIPTVLSGGSLLVSDMSGGMLHDYNSVKAKTKGITTQELFNTGQADFGVPTVLSGFAYALEKVGLKGVSQAMTKKLTGSAAKKAATLFFEWNKEGATEFVQVGLDAANTAIAEGKSIGEASEIAADTMFSKQGVESYLMGVVGSGAASSMGRLAKAVTSPKAKAAIQENVAEVERMSAEIVNPEATPETKAFIETQIRKTVSKIADEVDKDAEQTDKFGAGQKQEIQNLSDRIEAAETVISDPVASPETKALAQEEAVVLAEELETKLKEKPKKTALDAEIAGREEGTLVDAPVVEEVAEEVQEALPVEEDLAAPVLAKAEIDLEALKQVTDKNKKYEASLKRLSEAKATGQITENEFNETKARFDDVMGQSVPKNTVAEIPQIETEKPQPQISTKKVAELTPQEIDDEISALEALLETNQLDKMVPASEETKLSDKSKSYIEKVSPILDALFPHTNFNVYETTDEYVKKEGRSHLSAGVYNRDKNSIGLNMELINARGAESTIFHEAIHPIVDAVYKGNSKALDTAIEKIKTLSNVKGVQAVYEHAALYKGLDKETRQIEAITEFLSLVADNKIEAENLSVSAFTKVKDVFNELLKALGINYQVSTAEDLIRLSTAIKESFDTKNPEAVATVLKGKDLAPKSTGAADALSRAEAENRLKELREAKKSTEKTQEKTQEPEKTAPAPSKPAKEDTSKRAATQRVLKSDKYSQEFKDAITEKTIYYKELPNAVTDSEAEALIDVQGEDGAEKATYDFNNGMPSAVRFSVLQKLIDRYEARGEHLRAAELAEDLYSKATDYGQGIQIFSTFPKLSKQANVALARKTVATQRDALAKRAKPTTTKIAKEFKKANEESAKETVEAVKKTIEKVTTVKPTMITDLPVGYGTKNKVFTREKYLKAKQNLRKSLHSFAGGVPIEDLIDIAGYHMEATGRDFERFTRRMKADLGAKIKPYLKDIYGQTRKQLVAEGYDEKLFLSDTEIDEQINAQEGEVFKEKLDKAIAKKSAKEQKQAIAKLQQISKDEGLWGQYRDSAAKRLKNLVKTNIQTDIAGDPSLQQFTDGLVKNMRQKMAEAQPEQQKQRVTPRPDIEVIGDAYKNLEKYKDVWEKTQKEFQEKYAEQPEVLEAIDAYFGEILEQPFSDRALESAVRKGLKDMDKTISDLVVQHYTVVDHAKESLSAKLINEAGLEGRDAEQLAGEIERKFEEIATKKKEQILNRMFSKKTRKAHAAKGVDTELIKLTNLGGFTSAAIVEAYGEKMGWPKLTQENIDRIELLSDIIQNTKDPINRRRATEDLLAYQANLKGTSPWDIPTAIWYANILSGYNTQLINFGANAVNTGLLFANAVVQRPKDARFIGKGLLEGLKRGWLEGKDTFKTGYSPIKGRPEIPPLLERVTFKGGEWNPASYLKFVRRMMVAADVLFFEGQKEMRAYQLAKKQAMREGKEDPTLNQVDRAIELVGRASGQLEAIQQKYDLEHDQEVERINSQEDLSDADKKSLIKSLDSDKQRKIFDAIEQQRSGELIEETVRFASEGTYNYQPRGLLGGVAKGINAIIEDVPVLRYAVPFTNIIANVANETINYSPVAFARLKTGGWSNFRREELTPQQRADLMTKAIIGTGLMATAMVLSQVTGDDDEPILEITSNGTGDYAKNETLKKTGWQPYSFRVKLPNGEYSSWYSYQYSPLILSLGYIGHFNDLMKYKKVEDEEGVVSRLSKAAGLSTSSFFQATYLNGLGDFLSTVLDPRSSEGVVDKAAKGAVNAGRSLLLPNLYTQAAQDLERIFDVPKKEIRDVKGATPVAYAKALMAKTLQDIPYARNLFYDKINILGEPVMYDTDKFESDNTPDKIIDLLIDKKAVFAPMNRNAEKIYDVDLGRERALTDEEFYQYARQKGSHIKKALESNYDKFSKMGEDTFKKELSKIKTAATKEAKSLVGDIPSTTLVIEEADVTYSLSPEQVRRRLELIKEYTDQNKDAYDVPADLSKDARAFSKDQMLAEGYAPDAEGKFKLEIKD